MVEVIVTKVPLAKVFFFFFKSHHPFSNLFLRDSGGRQHGGSGEPYLSPSSNPSSAPASQNGPLMTLFFFIFYVVLIISV